MVPGTLEAETERSSPGVQSQPGQNRNPLSQKQTKTTRDNDVKVTSMCRALDIHLFTGPAATRMPRPAPQSGLTSESSAWRPKFAEKGRRPRLDHAPAGSEGPAAPAAQPPAVSSPVAGQPVGRRSTAKAKLPPARHPPLHRKKECRVWFFLWRPLAVGGKSTVIVSP